MKSLFYAVRFWVLVAAFIWVAFFAVALVAVWTWPSTLVEVLWPIPAFAAVMVLLSLLPHTSRHMRERISDARSEIKFHMSTLRIHGQGHRLDRRRSLALWDADILDRLKGIEEYFLDLDERARPRDRRS